MNQRKWYDSVSSSLDKTTTIIYGKEEWMTMLKGKDIILSLLYKESLTGYEIMERIQNRLGYFVEGSTGMIYPALKKLEKEGFITSEEIIQHDKPNKKCYTICENGRKAVQDYIESPISQDKFISDFLLRAYLETNSIKELVTHEIDQITKRLAKLIADNEAVIADMAAGQLFAYEFGKNMYQTQLNFLHRYLETEIRRSNP